MTTLLSHASAITEFPTVDAMHAFAQRLATDHPERVTLRDVGKSRNGDAIQLLTIRAQQPRGSVLVVGQPHPNEPIGMATITALCHWFTQDPSALDATGATWHFVPCADPDGTRLNEGWFAGPWTREHYARNFYRPPGEAQVEWTFPFRTEGFSVDAPMPETEALMAAIDEARPDVAASLHNGELGGAYFYASEGAAALYVELAEVCRQHDIPLHLGDPETPLSQLLAPAVFTIPTAQQLYDFAIAAGADPTDIVSGGSSLEYAQQYQPTFGLVVELPYWRDDRAADTTPDPSGTPRRDVILEGIDARESAAATLRALFDASSPLPPSPFATAVESFLGLTESGYLAGERAAALANPELEGQATVADVFSVRDNVHMFRLRMAGMLLRAVDPDGPHHAAVEETFAAWCAEAAADNRAVPIPITDLVGVQAGAILAAARHVLAP